MKKQETRNLYLIHLGKTLEEESSWGVTWTKICETINKFLITKNSDKTEEAIRFD